MKKIIMASVTAVFLCVNMICAQDIVFVLPKTLKVTSPSITVKGTVMEFDTKAIDITVVNLLNLVEEETSSAKDEKPWLETLKYETIPVRNGFFQKDMEIKEGINSIIAKPAKIKPTSNNISMKVVVLDKISPALEITEPTNDRIPLLKRISGRFIKKPYPKTVNIKIEALSSHHIAGERKYKIDKLMEISVPVKKKQFSVPISLSEMLIGDEIIMITVTTDSIEVTKTLF